MAPSKLPLLLALSAGWSQDLISPAATDTARDDRPPGVSRAVADSPAVQNVPIASSDTPARIRPRGGTWTEDTVLFDGAVLYDPGHFGGMFSVFPSVPRLEDPDGGPVPTTRSAVAVSTVGGTIATTGRLGGISWDLAGRRISLGLGREALLELGLARQKLDFGFNSGFMDWLGGLAWEHNGDTVRATIYQGEDDFSTDTYYADWENLAIPVNVVWRLGERWTLRCTGSHAISDQVFSYSDVFDLRDSEETWLGRGELSYDAGQGNLVSLGTEFDRFHVNLTESIPLENASNLSVTNSDLWAGWLQDKWVINAQHTVVARVRESWYGKTSEAATDPSISYEWRPNADWKVGAAWDHYTQFLTRLRFADLEMPSEFWYADQKPMAPTTQNKVSLDLERKSLTPLDLYLSMEGHYEVLHNLPLYSPGSTSFGDNSGLDPIASNFAWLDGYSMGGELSVGKNEGWWTGNVIYAYEQCILRQPPHTNSLGTTLAYPNSGTVLVGPSSNPPRNWRHAIQAVGTLRWAGPKADSALASVGFRWWNYFRSSLQFTAFTRPARILDPAWGGVDGQRDLLGDDGPVIFSEPESDQGKPAYLRLDLTPIDWGREGHWRFFFTVVNVTDHRNLWLRNSNTRTNPPTQDDTYSLGRFPLLLGYQRWF